MPCKSGDTLINNVRVRCVLLLLLDAHACAGQQDRLAS